MKTKNFDIHKLVLLAILTAIVIVLQLLGAFIRFGPFSISLVLMPIVVGAALVGPLAGAWLGLVFGAVVLATGDANVFMPINLFGTIFVVIIKGVVAGLLAGFGYKFFSKINKTTGAIAAAVLCPVGNTGIFILGLFVFFFPTMREWSIGSGFDSATAFIFFGMVGVNFFIELAINLLLCPAIIRIIQHARERTSVAVAS